MRIYRGSMFTDIDHKDKRDIQVNNSWATLL